MNKPSTFRLPVHVRPRQYDVELDARLGSDTFSGRVAIHLDLAQPSRVIELHARDLRLSDCQLAAGAQTLPGEIHLRPEDEAVALRFSEAVPAGPAVLRLAFRGPVGMSLRGLYLSVDGPEHLLCTQCEATDARAIFPCFDEPEFKARFQYRVTTAAGATVLANSPLVSVAEAPGEARTWTFGLTRPMSSYLVALVIGDIEALPSETVAGTPVQVWALRGKASMGAFAQRYTGRLLPWYETYFGVPYHFDKYDQVAVPGFAAGAMENSGLVLFRQSLLLMDPRTASWLHEMRIAHVVAHEFAHMWFGNLVTMRWWDDLWLNEAFAEWIAHKAVDELSPDYLIWDDFQRANTAALATDALESTHPIYSPVATAAEANELFDNITYTKGCAVLRMLENYLGAEDFRAGLRTYMREFAERNAVGADLWRHLQEASREPVTRIMESWIMQGGYPILALDWDPAAGVLHARQQRFFSNPSALAENSQHWMVPLIIRYEDDLGLQEARVLLQGWQAEVPLSVAGALRWCYANSGQVGFYRQDLSQPLLAAALAHLPRLSASEQMGLLGDQWALVRRGSAGIAQFLDVLQALAASEHYHVVAEVVARLHTVELLLEEAGDAPALARFRAWVARLFAGRLAALGFEPRPAESQSAKQQRVAVVDAMATLAQDPAAIAQAEAWMRREAADPAAVDPNLAPIFIAAAARFGDAARFDRYVRIFQQRREAGAAPQERDRYQASFPEFRSPELVARTLGLISQGVIPQENVGLMLSAMLRAPHTQLAAWEYLQERWAAISGLGLFLISTVVEATGQLPGRLRAEVTTFFDAHLNHQAPQAYARALETMDLLAEFKDRTRPDLVAWFARRP